MNGITVYIMSTLILILIYLSLRNKIPAYDLFINGCKEGIELFYQVFPALLAMMFCIRLLELSPFIDWIYTICNYLKLPISPSVSPLFIFRPISGSASLALYIDILSKEGGDSLNAILGGAIQGATDTTFYVIALYYGSIQVRKIGHTLWLSLLADILAMGLVVYLINIFM